MAGEGLQEVCETVGMPPVLSLGSCVDNSRILIACAEMVRIGGLGDCIADLPVAGCAPEYMSEKAICIGQYFRGLGCVHGFRCDLPDRLKAPSSIRCCLVVWKNMGFGKWGFAVDPHEIARLMIDHIDKKREALGIMGKKERKLFSMEDRRAAAGV